MERAKTNKTIENTNKNNSISSFTKEQLASFFADLSEEKRNEVLENFKEKGKTLDSEPEKFRVYGELVSNAYQVEHQDKFQQ